MLLAQLVQQVLKVIKAALVQLVLKAYRGRKVMSAQQVLVLQALLGRRAQPQVLRAQQVRKVMQVQQDLQARQVRKALMDNRLAFTNIKQTQLKQAGCRLMGIYIGITQHRYLRHR
jgi:hypothetical protein